MDMSAFIVISDPHYHDFSAFSKPLPDGTNSRLDQVIAQTIKVCYEAQQRGIRTVYFAGDIFHVRGSLKPSVLNPVMAMFWQIRVSFGMSVRVIAGNHDLESKDSEFLTSAVSALKPVGIDAISQPTAYEDDRVVLFPWFSKQSDLLDAMRAKLLCLNEPETWTAIIHAPLNGVIKGIPDTGICPVELSKIGYKLVLAGHYHNHKQLAPNVYSIGALTHQTWGDIGSKAGYLVVEDDRTVNHFETNAPRFIEFDSSWSEKEAESNCAGNYVRVRLGSVTESEVGRIREFVTGDCGALGCIVQATPQNKSTPRSATVVAAGGSTLLSIKEWIDQNIESESRDSLYAYCEEILNEVETVE